jgi:hypothetical protein
MGSAHVFVPGFGGAGSCVAICDFFSTQKRRSRFARRFRWTAAAIADMVEPIAALEKAPA